MILSNSVNDAWLGRTAAIEYDNAIQYAGVLVQGKTHKDILPGMVLKDLGNKRMALYDGTGTPFGLASLFDAPTYGKHGISQVGDNGEFTAIVGTSNTTVRIQKVALDSSAAFTVNDNGTAVPVYANAEGKVSATEAGKPIGKLLEVADDSIVIQLYSPAISA